MWIARLRNCISGILALGTSLIVPAVANGATAVAFSNANTIYVSQSGNDLIAKKGRADLPWHNITNAVRELNSGDTLVVLPGQYTVLADNRSGMSSWANVRYYAETHCQVSNKNDIRILGTRGASVISLSSTSKLGMFTFWKCSNVVVSGLTLRGVNPINFPNEPQPAPLTGGLLVFAGCQRVLVEDCDFEHFFGYGVMEPQAGELLTQTNQMILRNCRGYMLGSWTTNPMPRWEGGLFSGGGWHVTDNQVVDCGRGLEIDAFNYGTNTLAYGVVFARNVLVNIADIGMGTTLQRAWDPLFMDNIIIWRTNRIGGSNAPTKGYAIQLDCTTNAVVTGNYIYGGNWGIVCELEKNKNPNVFNNFITNTASGPYYPTDRWFVRDDKLVLFVPSGSGTPAVTNAVWTWAPAIVNGTNAFVPLYK